MDWFANMRWDWWEAFGLVGEALFFARLVVQWTASEKAQRPILPITYWYMSIVGCVILVFYALHLGSFVVLLPQAVGIVLYARNLQLELRHRALSRWRAGCRFDDPAYPWPTVSVIIPVHNEAKVLAGTLDNLCGQIYPGPKPEIVVALNGCTDASWAVAQGYDVKVVECEENGISLGRNLGARAATGEILVFLDADTHLTPEGLRRIVESIHGQTRAVVGVPGRPDRGGPVVCLCFWLANRYTRIRQVSPPGGITAVHQQVFAAIEGFDERLPQGTNTDFIMRAMAAGSTYIAPRGVFGITSIRRFEKRGIVWQMLEWRRNHKELKRGERTKVEKREYETIR